MNIKEVEDLLNNQERFSTYVSRLNRNRARLKQREVSEEIVRREYELATNYMKKQLVLSQYGNSKEFVQAKFDKLRVEVKTAREAFTFFQKQNNL